MAENRLVLVFQLVDEVSAKLRQIAASVRQFGARLQASMQAATTRVQRAIKPLPEWARDYIEGVPLEIIAKKYNISLEELYQQLEQFRTLRAIRTMRNFGTSLTHTADRVRRLNWQFTYMLLSMLGIMFNATILGRTLLTWFTRVLQPVEDIAKNLSLAALALGLMGEKLQPDEVKKYVQAFLNLKEATGLWAAVFVRLSPVLDKMTAGLKDLAKALLDFLSREDVKSMLEDLANGFRETSRKIAQFLGKLKPEELEPFANALRGLASAFSIVTDALSRILPSPIGDFFAELTYVLRNLDEGFRGVGQSILPVLATLFVLGTVASVCMLPLGMLTFTLASLSNILTLVGGAARMFSSILTTLAGPAASSFAAALSGPHGWLILLAAALAAVITYLYLTNDAFRNVVNQGIAAVVAGFQNLVAFLQASVAPVWPYLQTTVANFTVSLQGLYQSVAELIGVFYEFAAAIWEQVIAAFEALWPYVKDLAAGAVQELVGAAQAVIASWTTMVETLKTLLKILTAAVKGEWSKIPQILQQYTQRLIQIWQPVIDTWKQALMSFVNWVKTICQGIVEHFRKMVDDLIGLATRLAARISGMLSGAAAGIQNVFEGLR
ncbi:MAG: hypothetical protein DRH17_13405, partial [Deltaproteobacteria bacterium]